MHFVQNGGETSTNLDKTYELIPTDWWRMALTICSLTRNEPLPLPANGPFQGAGSARLFASGRCKHDLDDAR